MNSLLIYRTVFLAGLTVLLLSGCQTEPHQWASGNGKFNFTVSLDDYESICCQKIFIPDQEKALAYLEDVEFVALTAAEFEELAPVSSVDRNNRVHFSELPPTQYYLLRAVAYGEYPWFMRVYFDPKTNLTYTFTASWNGETIWGVGTPQQGYAVIAPLPDVPSRVYANAVLAGDGIEFFRCRECSIR